MRLLRLGILLSVSAVIPALVSSQQIAKVDGVTNLLDCSGAPCIAVRVGTGWVHFGVDTGNPMSMIDSSIVEENHWPPEPYVGPDGKVSPTLRTAVIAEVRAGDLVFYNLHALVAHLQRAKAAGAIPDVDGLLGSYQIRVAREWSVAEWKRSC